MSDVIFEQGQAEPAGPLAAMFEAYVARTYPDVVLAPVQRKQIKQAFFCGFANGVAVVNQYGENLVQAVEEELGRKDEDGPRIIRPGT